jgi:hypothetical protein
MIRSATKRRVKEGMNKNFIRKQYDKLLQVQYIDNGDPVTGYNTLQVMEQYFFMSEAKKENAQKSLKNIAKTNLNKNVECRRSFLKT